MQTKQTPIPGLLIIEPRIFPDGRGYFFETWHRERYSLHGITADFVQENISSSLKGTLRGLHYQYPHSQTKLVQVLSGEVFDVTVDIRRGSPTFGRWFGIILSSENKKQLCIPGGFAHGFCVLSDNALFTYKCDDFYAPDCEKGILWSDPGIGINWPIENPLLSDKDKKFTSLKDIQEEDLPFYLNENEQ